MNTRKTSASLLERLRQPNPAGAWSRFVDLYTPLLCACGRHLALAEEEAAELADIVLQEVRRRLITLEVSPEGPFRDWLREVMLQQYRKYLQSRPGAARKRAADIPTRRMSSLEDEVMADMEYRHHLASRALELLQGQFSGLEWQACRESAVRGKPAPEVAARLGISPAAVHIARYRVLRQLRNELVGLLD
jgi:RNA polymerase sigma-70 factor (ECF subfamily)